MRPKRGETVTTYHSDSPWRHPKPKGGVYQVILKKWPSEVLPWKPWKLRQAMVMAPQVQSMSEDIFPMLSAILTILRPYFAKAGSKVFSVSESSWTVKRHCETLHFWYYMKVDLTWARSPWSSSFWPVIPNGCNWGLELLNWFKTHWCHPELSNCHYAGANVKTKIWWGH